MSSCSKPSGQPNAHKGYITSIPKKDLPNQRVFPAPMLGSEEMDVWNGELALFQAKDIRAFMSWWDDDFVGWPNYSEYPVRKSDIEASVSDEFRAAKPASPLPATIPLAVTVFGDVAVTQYFWPETDESSPMKYRATHTWKKSPSGWRIISGMACAVPRATHSTTTR
jgi:ketosteroid isomerase-like protein